METLLSWIGAGEMPFLLPLLYEVVQGSTPVQSGLLIMPQFVAAISLKFTIPVVLNPARLPACAGHQDPSRGLGHRALPRRRQSDLRRWRR